MVNQMKQLLNYSEDKTFRELDGAAERHGLSAFPKVRVADVLPIENSGIDRELYRYALQAHFDFVVAGDDYIPLFAVEFDGPSHKNPAQAARDRKKNGLCKRFGFPILRTNLNYISRKYRELTILAWIVDVYHLEAAFDEAQAQGIVPYDEPFDPFFIISDGGRPGKKYPYWISLDANLAMHRLHKEGKLLYPGSSGFIGRDKEDVMRGIEFVEITEAHGLVVTSAMRPQDFPILFSELLGELLLILLFEKVEHYLAGSVQLVPMAKINACVHKYQQDYNLLQSHSIGRS